MLPDRVLNPGPLTYESGALPIALRHPARASSVNPDVAVHYEQHQLDLCCLQSQLFSCVTIQILCIGADRSQQTVQTKIRLLLKKQSDQGLRCLPFHPHLLDALMQCYVKLFYFYDNYGNCLRSPKF